MAAIAAVVALAGLSIIAADVQPSQAAAAIASPTWYLALGGSASVGVQPTLLHPTGEPTDKGYAEDLESLALQHWPGLRLERLGCPGETTTTMLHGGSRCRYPAGSQLSEADAFLRNHRVSLVTVDIGFNDVRPCLEHLSVNASCMRIGLQSVQSQLAEVLSSLKAASPSSEIIGVGHYDPFLADSLDGAKGRHFAAASVGALDRLDQTMQVVYAHFQLHMANVSRAFDAIDDKRVRVNGQRTSEEVARVCELTWMCRHAPLGPNLHPDDRGYRAIAAAIDRLLSRGAIRPAVTPVPAASGT